MSAARNASVLALGKRLDRLAQLSTDSFNGERDDLFVARGNRNIENAREITRLFNVGNDAVALIRPLAIADRGGISDEIALIRRMVSKSGRDIQRRDRSRTP